MRDPRNVLKPFLVKETQAARERLAAAHFDLEAISARMTDAAMRGEGTLRLPLGQVAAELRATGAADKLASWCQAQGLRLEWTEKLVERPNGLRLRTAEAILSWIEESLA